MNIKRQFIISCEYKESHSGCDIKMVVQFKYKSAQEIEWIIGLTSED